MKAAVLIGIGRIEVMDVPNPEIINDTDVLVRVKAVGVCGSDVHYYRTGRIGSLVVKSPFIMGHEMAGVVEQVGKGVTRVKTGQKVAIEPSVSCGTCDQCRIGRVNTCRNTLFLGTPEQMQGCLCEYVVMPEKCCFPVNDKTSFEQATLSEPLSIGIYTVERSDPPRDANVAILGFGPIGISVLIAIRATNAIDAGNIYITDRVHERLNYSKKFDVKWCGNPDTVNVVEKISEFEPLLLDIVYECSGSVDAMQQAVQLLKPGGLLVLVGIPETDDVIFPIHELRRKEITILNIRRQAHCTQKAIDLIEKKKIDVDWMITHKFSLEETQKAFDLVANYKDGVIKAFVCP